MQSVLSTSSQVVVLGDKNDKPVPQGNFQVCMDALARDLEAALLRLCEDVARALAEKERDISTIFAELQTTLVGLEQPFLAQRRAQIEFTQREITQLCADFDRSLACSETVRTRHSRELIARELNETMDIRRGVPAQVLQMLADESKKISSAILRNREAYAAMSAQLRVKCLELDKIIAQSWSAVEHTWRVLNYKHTIEKFKSTLASSIYRNPPTRISTLEAMRTEQRTHHARMLDQLHAVFRLAPPTQLTPQGVEEWYIALRSVLAQASQVYKRKAMTLRAQEDVMHTSGQELVSKLRDDLREFRVVDDRDMASILAECKGLIDTRNRDSLTLLAHVEATLDVYASALTHACASLRTYLVRVAALLEIQEREATSVKQAHQEKLANLHSEFITANKIQEDNLKKIIDVMQAEVDDEELYRQLQKALDTLRVIEEGYRNFCAGGVALSMEYPNNTKEMLIQQQEAICMIFSITKDEALWRSSKRAAIAAATPVEEQKENEKEKEVPEKEELPVEDKKPKKRPTKRDWSRVSTPNNPSRPSTRPPSSTSTSPVPGSLATSPVPSRSTSTIIARRKSPQPGRRRKDAKDNNEESKEETNELVTPSATPPPDNNDEANKEEQEKEKQKEKEKEKEKELEEDVDIVTTPNSKYFILSNRPSLLHPEDPPPAPTATASTQAQTTQEPQPSSASSHVPASANHHVNHHAVSTPTSNNGHVGTPTAHGTNRIGTAHRLGQQSAAFRRRPGSSRVGASSSSASLLSLLPVSSPPPPPPPRTQAQEINDEVDKLKAELIKGPLGVPVDPDGTHCLEMFAVPEALIQYLERNVRRAVITHIEGLFNTLLLTAIEEGKNSKKAFTADLEERLRLHRPRSGHIELEIYHQRAGALHAHRVRFDRHVQTVTENFHQECRGVNVAIKEVQDLLDGYTKAQQAKIASMGNANNTLTLQVLLREARDVQKTLVDLITTKIADIHARVNEICQSVTDENSKYTENLRKEGASSESEISHLSAQLGVLAQSVDAKGAQHHAHIDHVAQELVRSAAYALAALESAHAAHHEDLTFLEGINFRCGTLASKIRAESTRCERQSSMLASLVERLASPAANELLPLVDAIRRGVYNRAMYLDVLQSPITLTTNLLGPNIAPLLPLAALSFLPEGEADSGEDDEDGEEEITNREREERGKPKKGKSGGASSRRQSGAASADTEEEDKEKEKEKGRTSTSMSVARKKGKSSASTTPSPLPPVPIASAAPSAPGSAARSRRLATTKRERVLPFLATIARILKASRKESHQLCEEYYRTKGDRAVTRPNRIPPSLPLLLQSLEETFTQHEQASNSHHTMAVKDFHTQLSTACSHLCNVPRSIFQVMTNGVLVQCRGHHEQMEAEFTKKKNTWKQEREKLHNFIRPQMSHPNYHAQLESCAVQAQQEHTINAASIATHCDAVKRIQDDHATRMCEELGSTSEALLQLLDEFILPQDLSPLPAGAGQGDGSVTSMQQVLKKMHSINLKSVNNTVPDTPSTSSSSILPPIANLRESTVDSSETEKSALKGKKEPEKGKEPAKGEPQRKSRLGVRIKEETSSPTLESAHLSDSLRPFPKQTYPPLSPLPAHLKEQQIQQQQAVSLPPATTTAKGGKKAASNNTPTPVVQQQRTQVHTHYATPAHECVHAARTHAYNQYQQHYSKALSDTEMLRTVLLDEEQRDFDYLMQALVLLRKQHGGI